jgi:hypothetical protein
MAKLRKWRHELRTELKKLPGEEAMIGGSGVKLYRYEIQF